MPASPEVDETVRLVSAELSSRLNRCQDEPVRLVTCYPSAMPTTSPNAARRSEPARRAILAAALDQVAEVGYAKLSIEGIAGAAGVGKQTIYRWWPSKGAVLLDSLLALS